MPFKLKCPVCGATGSLGMWLAHEDSRDAIVAAFELSGELGKVTLRYLRLFRPAKSDLSHARVAKLIKEFLPHIQSQRLPFDGKLFDAPPAAWIYAMNEMLRQNEENLLTLPMANHNYLYRIISAYKAPADAVEVMPTSTNSTGKTAPASQMEVGVTTLQSMKRGNP